LYVRICFWKNRPQSEGSRDADHGIKSPPGYTSRSPIRAGL
jgi:hypothetical protein